MVSKSKVHRSKIVAHPISHMSSPLTTIDPEQYNRAEGQHSGKHVEHAAFFRRVSMCQEIAKRQEHQTDEEIRDP